MTPRSFTATVQVEKPTLAQIVADRLRAGALVLVVQDADEALALAEVQAGVAACAPVVTLSGADENATSTLEAQATGRGTLILLDFLSIYGENAVTVRLIRQVALQNRDDGTLYSRLVLIERPDVRIPAGIAGDVEVVAPPLPSVEELGEELALFLDEQPTALEGNGETRYAISAAGAGLARHEFARLLARCVIERGSLDPVWIRQEKAKRVAVKLGGALTFEDPDAADVGGLGALLAWLGQRAVAFASQAAKAFGLPEPKGVLIVGVPGGGKSLTAKMIARVWGLPLIRLDVGRLFGSLVGQSEAQARGAIGAAEACAPCVLWVDEIEKGFAGGASGASTDSGTTQRVFGTLLTWMQEKKSPVFVVATANRVEALPPELLRKGRFDEIFSVGLPSLNERKAIVRIHLQRRGRDLGEPGVRAIAEATNGFTGAELEQVIVDGLYAAFARRGSKVAAATDLTTDDVLDAVRATTPLSKTAPEDIQRIEAWAKGRARPASLPEVDPVVVVAAGRRRGPSLQKGV